jgi:DNA-binding GntR family transcriptional regulator
MACLSRRYTTALDELPLRILSEFDEQPGLRLTFAQVRRLWDVSEVDCREALTYLVRSGLLGRDPAGQYCIPGRRERTPWISS